jgi:hypothetical protein
LPAELLAIHLQRAAGNATAPVKYAQLHSHDNRTVGVTSE